ncbi:MAG TPA: Dyp-type peroxidase [Solirubrobacteraceae bacterium]
MTRIHPLRARTQKPRLEAIQGNVLQGYSLELRVAAYVWLRFRDAAAGRRWLELLDVTSAAPWDDKPAATRNVALTADGLRALEVAPELLRTFSDEFLAGMRARAVRPLGDTGPSAPETWPHPFDGAPLHALLTLYARDERTLDELIADAPADGVEIVDVTRAGTLSPQDGDPTREHFGFTDGFSQPSFRNVTYKQKQPRGNGVPLRFGRWRRLALGELVLGYVDEDRVYPEMPGGALGPNSTYMVWRRLRQDVAAFRAWTLGAAEGDPVAAEKVRAQVVGRWADGTPLLGHPDGPDRDVSLDPERRNAVRYRPDPHGSACPLGAHVRRSNPRDGLPFGHKLTFRHRIVRRGMPYGPELGRDPTPEEQETDRGLVFVCFNANISRQYEVVQGEWLSDGRSFDLGHDRDPLTGGPQDDGKFVLQGRPAQNGKPATPPKLLSPLPRFVWTRGGEYLWVPSIPALSALGAGTEASA